MSATSPLKRKIGRLKRLVVQTAKTTQKTNPDFTWSPYRSCTPETPGTELTRRGFASSPVVLSDSDDEYDVNEPIPGTTVVKRLSLSDDDLSDAEEFALQFGEVECVRSSHTDPLDLTYFLVGKNYGEANDEILQILIESMSNLVAECYGQVSEYKTVVNDPQIAEWRRIHN